MEYALELGPCPSKDPWSIKPRSANFASVNFILEADVSALFDRISIPVPIPICIYIPNPVPILTSHHIAPN